VRNSFHILFLFFCLSFASFLSAQQGKYVVINNISISGNFRTNKRIILRELNFKSGDTILSSELEVRLQRARFNIQNTLLFNFVRIDTIPYFKNQIDLLIDVKERWYLFPIPTLANGEEILIPGWKIRILQGKAMDSILLIIILKERTVIFHSGSVWDIHSNFR